MLRWETQAFAAREKRTGRSPIRTGDKRIYKRPAPPPPGATPRPARSRHARGPAHSPAWKRPAGSQASDCANGVEDDPEYLEHLRRETQGEQLALPWD